MKQAILKKLESKLEIVLSDAHLPSTEQILLKLKAAALNHRDIWIIKGLYRGIKLPVILGSDGAGVYNGESFLINPNLHWGGSEASPSSEYQILGLQTPGTFQEEICISQDRLVSKPLHLGYEEAAALPLAGLTAYRVLFTKCNLQSDEKVFISGIGGGVALMAFQFALAAGAQVYVSSSTEEKIQRAIDMGAEGGIIYTETDWHKEFIKRFGGVDVIIDSAGGPGFQNLIRICNPAARVGIYGGTQGAIPSLMPQRLFFKQISILGSTMGSDHEFQKMVEFVGKHEIKPVIDSVFSLNEINKALDRMSQGLQFGKIVISMK